MAAASPGTAWYLFGEPNKYGYITGDRFAPVFRHLSTHIKLGDPTATIVSPSILNWEWTCYQLCYYEPGKNWIAAFIATYETEYGEKPPVDAWAIDAYPIDWVRTPNTGAVHAPIAIDQISGLSDYLAAIPEYQDTPIWITEIALHVGYDGWTQDSGNFVPVGVYHWDALRRGAHNLLVAIDLAACRGGSGSLLLQPVDGPDLRSEGDDPRSVQGQ